MLPHWTSNRRAIKSVARLFKCVRKWYTIAELQSKGGEMAIYKTQGTCSRAIEFEVKNGVLTKCAFSGGCPGNTQGVAKLAVGRNAKDVIAALKGIQCRNGTSCPDQLARALEAAVSSMA